MRTTLVIDDELFVSVKKLAAERGMSVSAVVVEALRGFVHRPEGGMRRARFMMPTFDGGCGKVDTPPLEFHELDEESDLAPYGR